MPIRTTAWIIEDDPAVAGLFSDWLKNLGYRVVVSSTLADARFVHPQLRNVSLVILDIGLPDGSGMEMLPLLQQQVDAPEIAIVTGDGSMEASIDAMRAGVSDFMLKPVTESDFRAMHNRISARQQLRLGNITRFVMGVNEKFDTIIAKLSTLERDLTEHIRGAHGPAGT